MALQVAKTYPGVQTPDELSGLDWGLQQKLISVSASGLKILSKDDGSVYDGDAEIEGLVSDIQDYIDENPVNGDGSDWLEEHADNILDIRNDNPVGARFLAQKNSASIQELIVLEGGSRVPLSAKVFNGCQFSFVQKNILDFKENNMVSVTYKFKDYKKGYVEFVDDVLGNTVEPSYDKDGHTSNDKVFYKYTSSSSIKNTIRSWGSEYHLDSIRLKFYSLNYQTLGAFIISQLRFGVELNVPNPEQYRFTMPVRSNGNTLIDSVQFEDSPETIKQVSTSASVTEATFSPQYNGSYNQWCGNCNSVLITTLDGKNLIDYVGAYSDVDIKFIKEDNGGELYHGDVTSIEVVSGNIARLNLNKIVTGGGSWPLDTDIRIIVTGLFD